MHSNCFSLSENASKHQNLLLVLKYIAHVVLPTELIFSEQAFYNQTISLILKGSINSLS